MFRYLRSKRPFITVSMGLMVVAILLSCSSSSAMNTYYEEQNITFRVVDDVPLQLDLAAPKRGRGPYPALVYLYGSAWGWNRAASRVDYAQTIKDAAQRGYVAVTIDYRRISVLVNHKSKYPFPAQVIDVKCAVRWLRANAKKYRIDPDRIGVVGFSSSGHLALMVGFTDSKDGMEGDCDNQQLSSRVQAVANFSGETEMASIYKIHPDIWTRYFLQGNPEETPDLYWAATPLNYITEDDPPVLSIYGTSDRYVPIEQAYLLDKKMKEIGVPHELIIREGADHQDYSREDVVWAFLDDKLKRKTK